MKRPVFWLVLILLFLPFLLISYRIAFLGYPPFPTAPQKAWEISMDAHVLTEGKEVTVKIGLPSPRPGQTIIEERFTSGSLDFGLLQEGPNRVGVWSGEIGERGEMIGYRMTILSHSELHSKPKPPKLGPYPVNTGKLEQELAERLVAKWIRLDPPSRLRAIAATALGHWGDPPPKDQDLKLWSVFQEKQGRLVLFMVLLKAAGLPAQVVEGLLLREGVTSVPVAWLEVWTGKEWERMWAFDGKIERGPEKLIALSTGEVELIRLNQGKLSDTRWILDRKIISQWRHHFERIRESPHWLDRWSLFHLPSQFQETFRILILVPMGALLICVLRNLIGFPTFGIFMPVLMALAFRNTGLLYGIGIFAGFVFIGYASRRFMERLHLLLVPRLSIILTLVIILFTVVALMGSKWGLWRLMAVGLLPFVILTMTIERFFVIVEEAGIREGLRTALGSAFVATITYGILRFESLQLTFFVYPELLFAVAAVQVLLGRYTGYRLSEFLRFRKFRGPG